MAIFSQNNSKTETDFRGYDNELPNRNGPYKLPKKQEKMIVSLMKGSSMNCCSIDLIYGSDKNYYFLEINPIGQYGMVNYPCNYYLDEKSIKFLI